jgi:hypothetical protein
MGLECQSVTEGGVVVYPAHYSLCPSLECLRNPVFPPQPAPPVRWPPRGRCPIALTVPHASTAFLRALRAPPRRVRHVDRRFPPRRLSSGKLGAVPPSAGGRTCSPMVPESVRAFLAQWRIASKRLETGGVTRSTS